MSETDRRKFLAAAGVGAAGAAVGAVGLAAPASAATRNPGAAKESVLAYVADHHSDRVVLHVGEREVVVRDRDLVTRLLNAAGGN